MSVKIANFHLNRGKACHSTGFVGQLRDSAVSQGFDYVAEQFQQQLDKGLAIVRSLCFANPM